MAGSLQITRNENRSNGAGLRRDYGAVRNVQANPAMSSPLDGVL